MLISCHGAFTHVAFNYGLYIYDIIEEKKLSHYNRITKHMSNYKSIFRKDFSSISKEINLKIMNFIEKYNHKKNIRFKLFKKTLEIAKNRGLKNIVETGTSRGKNKFFFLKNLIGKMV